MNKGMLLTILLSIVVLAGCRNPGMNMKLGSADAGAGIAVVGTLEAVPAEKFETTKTKIIEISTALLGFIETGELSQLPLDTVKDKLEAFMIQKGYGDYTYLIDTFIQYVKTQNVNVGRIGKNNVELIKVAIQETIRNAKRCTLEGRTNWQQQ